mgnify:FL=1|tara:strand:+ start:1096 stop:1464 length:369 start_codon:yes stop_codon:yes gene_type:complete
MAHFAKIENNKVIEVAVVENAVIRNISGDEQESLGQDFLRKIKNEPDAVWLQCSYNQKIRNFLPSVGWSYSKNDDAFYPPKPFASWVWDIELKSWMSPIGQYPDDNKQYTWNETTKAWDEVT